MSVCANRYDTVVDNVWHGFCMLVTADPGSIYDPKPTLRWSAEPWKPKSAAADGIEGLSVQSTPVQEVQGQPIYTYHALSGGNTFWRFKLEIPLTGQEQTVHYNINVSQRCAVVPAD